MSQPPGNFPQAGDPQGAPAPQAPPAGETLPPAPPPAAPPPADPPFSAPPTAAPPPAGPPFSPPPPAGPPPCRPPPDRPPPAGWPPFPPPPDPPPTAGCPAVRCAAARRPAPGRLPRLRRTPAAQAPRRADHVDRAGRRPGPVRRRR